jgi:hypothetical protein
MVSSLTGRSVKITVTGPHMLAAVAYDEYYNDIGKMMLDLAKLLRRNFRMLVEAGCRNIQLDEPLFTMPSEEEVRAAVEAIKPRHRGYSRPRPRLSALLSGQLCRRQGIRRTDRSSLFRHWALQGRSRLQYRVLVFSGRARHDASLQGSAAQSAARRRRGEERDCG